MHYLVHSAQEVEDGLRFRSELDSTHRIEWHPHSIDPDSFLQGLVSPWLSHFALKHSRSLEQSLFKRVRRQDLVWISRLRMGIYAQAIEHARAFTVLDGHQIEGDLELEDAYLSVRNIFKDTRKTILSLISAMQNSRYEKNTLEQIRWLVTSSPIDAIRLQKYLPKSQIRIVPHSIDLSNYPFQAKDPETKPLKFVFLCDWDYFPNREAATWWKNEIEPRIQAALNPTAWEWSVLTPCRDPALEFPPLSAFGNIETYSNIEELRNKLGQASVAFFPLRHGRGNRVHFMEAMAVGVPIVTTGRAADGIEIRPSVDVLVQDEPDPFTSSILRIVRDPELRNRLKTRARESVVGNHRTLHTESEIKRLFQEIGVLNDEDLNLTPM